MASTDDLVVSTIRAEMARRGILQKDIAAELNISVAGVSDRLCGKTPIKVDEIQAIARRLGVPVSVLLGEPQPTAAGAA